MIIPALVRLVRSTVIISAILSFPLVINAQQVSLGSPIDVSGGIGYMSLSSPPSWASDSYTVGELNAHIRLYRGLGIQFGAEQSRETSIDDITFPYGSNTTIEKADDSKYSAYSVAIRYELPYSRFDKHNGLISTVYAQLGYIWGDFDVITDSWTINGEKFTNDGQKNFKITDFSGPSACIGCRIRLKEDNEAGTSSLLGNYGFDLSVRYSRLMNADGEHDTIPDTGDDLDVFHLRAALYLTMGFLQ